MKKLTVVISQAQSKDPRKRELEENILAALITEPDIAVSIVPHLYDLSEGHTGLLFLRSVSGPLLVMAWLYPRAIHWTLDRIGVKGQFAETQLEREEDEDDGEIEEAAGQKDDKPRIGAVGVPDRKIWSLDLQEGDSADMHVKEILRIAAEIKATALPLAHMHAAPAAFVSEQLLQTPGRRWYPVIDYSRCTNCMECIDFCLFGVYGVDDQAHILVENQDNCKKGCPACSRVCPENAIVFPMHRTPAIAGAPGEGPGALKLDLSKLFGAPSAIELAAKERDVELVGDGRDAVGLTVGIPKRQDGKEAKPKDDLDNLMDALDDAKL